jgi:group I intron endonuclease
MVVYWIHLPNQTDVFTQGYVGIAENFEQRMFAHKSCAKNNHKNIYYRAIRKYGWENLKKDVILVGETKYCMDVEQKLRSAPKIGWNIAIGGNSGGLHLQGVKQSDGHLANRKKALIGRVSGFLGKKHTQAAKEKCREINLGKVLSETSKQKISERNSQKIEINQVIYPSWKSASENLGIPMGSISYLLASKQRLGKYGWIKTMSLVM